MTQHLDKIEFHPDVTFIVGENGAGISTLIEAIALSLGFSAEGGRGISTWKLIEIPLMGWLIRSPSLSLRPIPPY